MGCGEFSAIGEPLLRHDGDVISVVISANGRTVASGSFDRYGAGVGWGACKSNLRYARS